MSKKLTKPELINILTEKYGYSESDLREDNKPLTNAKLEMLIKKEEDDAREFKELSESETIIASTKNKIKDDDLVVVVNGLSGSLTHRSLSTGRVWRFTEFGQTEKIPYSEILSIRNTSPTVFSDGWMIILNRQIQEDFGLTSIYENILTPDNIDSVFEKDIDDLKEFIDGLPKGMKTTFISKAKELYNNKDEKLDSKRMIDFIENEFNISLDDNAPLSDIV